MVSTETGDLRRDSRADSGLPQIASTKTIPPSTNRSRIERKRLLDALREASARRLILIKAPAGYGKTTLAVDWREHLRQSGGVTAWLSLDDGDNEPSAFAYHLGSALHRAAPELGQSAMDLVAETNLIASKNVVSMAINAVAESDDEVYLLLDDYHAVTDQRSHDLTGYLLRYAPSNFHLVIVSRTEPPLPISRLRLVDDLAEIDIASLRFTYHEAVQFLGAELVPKLGSSEIARLYEATEGWPAALQLARIAVRNSTDPVATIRSFSGASRQISAYIHDTLATQADEVVEFLLKTAILDRLHGDLCRAVTGITRSVELLKALDHQQLLLVGLDEEGTWYRYHHLMTDYLLDRLRTRMPDQVADLHRRAYDWFASEQMWSQAVQHAIAAKDFDRALGFVDHCGMDMVGKGDLLTLLSWDRHLPPELMSGQFRVKLSLAWGMALVTRLNEADRTLAQVEEMAEADRGSDLWWRCRVARAVICGLQDNSARALEIVQECLAHQGHDTFNLYSLGNLLRYAHWKAGDWNAFYAAPRVERSDDDSSYILGENYRLCLWGTAASHRLEFGEALTLFAEARVIAEEYVGRKAVAAIMTTGLSALVRYEQGHVAGAEVAVLDELAIIEATVYHESFLRAYTVLVHASALRGDFERALKLVDRAERLAAERGWNRLVAVFLLQRLRLLLREGRTLDAESVVARLHTIAADHPAPVRCSWSDIHTCLAVGEGLLALSFGKPSTAVGKLDAAFRELQATDNRHDSLRVGLELANAHFRTGGSAKALEIIHLILGWAAKAGAVTFLRERGDEFVQLLAWARRNPSIGADAAVAELLDLVVADSAPGRETLHTDAAGGQAAKQLLSARERSIIEFIAGGQSNKQIARTLGVAPETIKTHVKRIFVKLAAESRAQAVVRAQSLGLLRNVEVN